MVNKTYIALTWIMMGILIHYFYLNIDSIGEGGVGLILLFVAVALGVFLILWRVYAAGNIYIRNSFFLLMVFYVYLMLRIVLDIGSMQTLKAYTIATSGGTLLAYCLGLMVFMVFCSATMLAVRNRSNLKFFTFSFFIFLAVSTLSAYKLIFSLGQRLRNDLLLIADLEGAYQRPGDFLMFIFLLLSFSYACVVLANQTSKTALYSVFKPFFIVIYLTFSLCLIVSSQMFGSNKGLALILSIFLITISFLAIFLFPKTSHRILNTSLKLKSLVLGKLGQTAVKFMLVSTIAFVFITIVFVNYTGMDMSIFRIMNFGKGGPASSITGRIEIAQNNFFIHFQDSPVLGNMNVDTETTGKGSYVHSTVAYLFTHTGIIGATMYFLYLALAGRELLSSRCFSPGAVSRRMENGIKIYLLFACLPIFILAMVGTTVTWMPLWFAMGLLLSPIAVKSSK